MGWILFDLDGTLLDSLGDLEELWNDLVRATDLTGAITFEQCNGLGLSEIVDLMVAAGKGRLSRTGVMRLYREGLATLYAGAAPTEGAADTLKRLNILGWRMGVVTAAPREFASLVLERQSWLDQVKLLVSGDEVKTGKPAPDLYLRGLEKAASSSVGAFAVEDSPNGVKAAVGAGLETIGFAGHSSAGLLRKAGAVDTVDHLLELVEHPRLRS